ncbi:MAG: hypothetical protein LBS91_02815 [Clostridiales Family XIII bacterium]|jgi:hypothetical protein|nr:hypothetical protein [Clostridiales Family XIII bacterium]
MNSPNNKGRSSYAICLATPDDAEAIDRIFDCMEFSGGIGIRFERKPNPYLSLAAEGYKAVICLLKNEESGQAVGVGACVMRKAFVCGREKNVGYLTGLKLLPGNGKLLRFMPDFYAFLRAHTKEADLYMTTILSDNLPARHLLEKRRRNMPRYLYRGDYTVYCLKPGGRALRERHPRAGGAVLRRGADAVLRDFYQKHQADHDLAAVVFDSPTADFYSFRGGDGEITAACAVWNQQSYKQYRITGYGGAYKALSKLPVHLLGYPAFPKAGAAANYASAALLHAGTPKIAADFLRAVLAETKAYDLLLLGLYENDPLHAALRQIKHFRYRSRLYLVDFEGSGAGAVSDAGAVLNDATIRIDVGLL